MSVAVKPEEREAPTCECRPQCWQRIPGNVDKLWKLWHIVHAPTAKRPNERNYFIRLVIAGHEDGMPVLEQGEGWTIVNSPGEEA